MKAIRHSGSTRVYAALPSSHCMIYWTGACCHCWVITAEAVTRSGCGKPAGFTLRSCFTFALCWLDSPWHCQPVVVLWMQTKVSQPMSVIQEVRLNFLHRQNECLHMDLKRDSSRNNFLLVSIVWVKCRASSMMKSRFNSCYHTAVGSCIHFSHQFGFKRCLT